MAVQATNGVITAEEPDVGQLDGCGYLFGYPVAHSLSPLLHQTIFSSLGLNYDYFLLQSTDIRQFLRLVRGSKSYGRLLRSKWPRYQLMRCKDRVLQCHIN